MPGPRGASRWCGGHVRWRPCRAYALATPHGLDDGIAFVDLAFLAGFIALEYLDARQAIVHFRALRRARVQPDFAGAGGVLGRARA